jgi:hypothetical protein
LTDWRGCNRVLGVHDRDNRLIDRRGRRQGQAVHEQDKEQTRQRSALHQ